MATLTYYIVIIGFILLTLGLLFIFKKFKKNNEFKILKILSLTLCLIFVVRYFYSHDILEEIVKDKHNSPLSSWALTIIGTLLIWFMRAGMLSIVLYPFLKNNWLKNMVKFWGLPIYLISLIFIPQIFKLTSGL